MKTQNTLQKYKNSNTNLLIVDGFNVLKYKNGINDLKNFDYVRKWAINNGITPLFILPGFRKFKEEYKNDTDVLLIDPSIYDDIAILAYARELDAAILSNDRYREFRKMFHDYNFEKVFPFTLKQGKLKTRAIDYFFFNQTNIMNQSQSNTFVGAAN